MIALLGFGKTNQALLAYLNRRGDRCAVFDDQFLKKREDDFGNVFLPSSEDMQTSMQIPSPGIPPFHSLISSSSNLVSEYDLLLHNQEQIWISGTNGKTTTTEMLEWILHDFGGVSGGNIGTPLASLASQCPKIWILETSSFSLHYTQRAYPKVYLLLPVREDHISWHGSFEQYVKAKLSPLERMRQECTAIIPQELENQDEILSTKAKVITYKTSQDLADFFGFDLKKVDFKEPFLLDAMMALSGAKLIVDQDLSDSLASYKIGDHKMETFKDVGGRVWIDDSKGTNVDATIWALRANKDKKIYLILGGDDKGADLAPLFDELQKYDIEIFGIGSNARKLEALSVQYGFVFHLCRELKVAIEKIDSRHTQESVAILSPAAASLDQFASYKERGEMFQRMAKVLGKKN